MLVLDLLFLLVVMPSLPALSDLEVGVTNLTFPVTPGTTYIVKYREATSDTWSYKNITVFDNMTELTVDGLTPKQLHELQVSAIDASGEVHQGDPIRVTLGVPGLFP